MRLDPTSAIRSLVATGFIVAVAWALPSYAGSLAWPAAAFMPRAAGTLVSSVKAAAAAEVVEYYHAGLDNYFITGDPVEQAAVDSGVAGTFRRTGDSFRAGGPSQVCRFYGNTNINPATGAIYGPNSHFYTADPAECASLKAAFTPNAKSWKFESNDFLTTPALNGACPAGLVPVYRAYNNGFARGVDSNHRITSNLAAYQQSVAAGWAAEGVVMCAPGSALPPQLTACRIDDCPAGPPLGNGTTLVNIIVEIANTTTAPIELVIPAGQTFVSSNAIYQDGMTLEILRVTIASGTTGRFVLRLFCMNQDREASATGAIYAPGPITTKPQLLDLVSLASGKLGATLDPATIKATAMQFAVWEITNGPGSLTAQQRSLLVSLLAAAADDLMTQSTIFEQFKASLFVPS